MTQTAERTTQALAVREAPASTALVPTNLQQAASLAGQLAKSGLIPAALRGKPEDVLVVLLKGHELGLAPMQALSSIHVISGKAVCEAALMVGLCLSHRDLCEYFTLVDSTDASATYETLRRGAPEPVRMTYTFAQAQTAKLTGKDNWTNHRAAMLRARASSALARAVYPDLCAGIYTPDEADEFREKPEPRKTTARRVQQPEAAAPVAAEDIDLGQPVPGEDIIPPASEEPPRPAETVDEPGAGDGPPVDEGMIEKVITAQSKPGASRPWQRFDLYMNGHRFSTFDKKMGAFAQESCTAKRRIRVTYHQTDKGRDITELVTA